MISHSFLHRQTIVALFVIPFLGWVSFNTPHFQQENYKIKPIHYTPEFFKLLTIGQWPAAVEGMWIQLLQEISENKINQN